MSDRGTPVHVTTTLQAQPGREDALRVVLRALAEAVRREEEGCLGYVPVQSRHDPSLFAIFEQYRDDQALKDHANSEHLNGCLPELMACLVEPPALRIYDGLEES